jgi:Domain of unknown function (DUF4190)
MTNETQQPGEGAIAVPPPNVVPIDMSRYEIPPNPQTFRTYHDDDPEPELYLDGAGGVTNDRSRAVPPSALVSEPPRETVTPYPSRAGTEYSDLGGYYTGLAAGHRRSPEAPEPSPVVGSRPSTASPPSPQFLQPTNAFAIVALVCALIGGSLLAIVFGHVSLSQIRRSGERGEGLANAALVIGYLSLVASVIILIVSISSAANGAL